MPEEKRASLTELKAQLVKPAGAGDIGEIIRLGSAIKATEKAQFASVAEAEVAARHKVEETISKAMAAFKPNTKGAEMHLTVRKTESGWDDAKAILIVPTLIDQVYAAIPTLTGDLNALSSVKVLRIDVVDGKPTVSLGTQAASKGQSTGTGTGRKGWKSPAGEEVSLKLAFEACATSDEKEHAAKVSGGRVHEVMRDTVLAHGYARID